MKITPAGIWFYGRLRRFVPITAMSITFDPPFSGTNPPGWPADIITGTVEVYEVHESTPCQAFSTTGSRP